MCQAARRRSICNGATTTGPPACAFRTADRPRGARRLDIEDDDVFCLECLQEHGERVARAPRILVEVIRDADARPTVGFLRDLAYRARPDALAEALAAEIAKRAARGRTDG